MIEERRPNPEDLLNRLKADQRREGRGRLKLFFGFAPGVGKTYAMLQAAQIKRAEKVDIVAGVVETHGRAETEALLEGLEVLPRKQIEYRDVVLNEFDVDAALKRHPSIILIDELAHTNAPNSRHPKRWHDVEELLDSGIDVYSTLNVQHLESLNDVVSKITGITVRETVPDSVLDQANEVELVDLSPEDLAQRLNEGKVYVPAEAARAIERFFRKGNLIALRELSLRAVANRVAEQMRDYKREKAIRQTWAAGDRLLVGVGPSPFSIKLVRAARRMAENLHAEWFAVSVETPSSANMTKEAQDRVAQTLRLAAQLGAQTRKISGTNPRDEILAFAREHDVTKILVGKPLRRRLKDFFRGSVVDDLIWNCGDIDVYVISGEGEEARPAAKRIVSSSAGKRGFLFALAGVALCTAIDKVFFPHLALTNLVMIYLLGIVAVALRFGRGPAIFASILSVLTFDFLFVPPYHTLAVSSSEYAITLVVMLLISVLISNLTVRVRQEAQNSRKQEQQTAALYEMSRKLVASRGLEELLGSAADQMARIFDSRIAIFLPDENGLLQLSVGDTSAETEHRKLGVATWVFEHNQIAGTGTETIPGAKGIYLPLRTGEKVLGVIRMEPLKPQPQMDPEQIRFLEAFVSQIALGVERESLSRQTRAVQIQMEAERMRNALLSSVSHDLRTPLSGIAGSASALLENENALSEESRQGLIRTIYEESNRLDRLVNNLLEMSRLQSGEVRLNKEWHVIEEIVGTCLAQLETQLQNHPVTLHIPQDLPLVFLDARLIERVLVNLLENAVKYTPDGTSLELSAKREGEELLVEISDHGPGFPAGEEKRIFEKFHQSTPDQARGIGLGLSICRVIVHAHEGRIWAENRVGGGAVFRFTLPMKEEMPEYNPLFTEKDE